MIFEFKKNKLIPLVLIGFLLAACEETNTSEPQQLPATFTFDENLAIEYGKVVSASFEVTAKNVARVDLYFNDSIVQQWKKPSGRISFDLDASYYGLGAKQLTLKSTLIDGKTFSDSRLIRINSDVEPEQWQVKIASSFPHNPLSFTQGLEFSDGVLYESTGDPNRDGSTMVAQVNLKSGAITAKKTLDGNYFGEGITILGNRVYQLTWTEQKCFMYDKKSLEMDTKDFSYTGEGWGLCNDGKSIIMSDGTERLVFRNPTNFQIERTIEVYDKVGPRSKLNELEYIDGKIYANVWMLDLVLVIDPNSGRVLAEIDASDLATVGKGSGDVLNGIAYNPATKKIYMTGKYWSKLFEVTLVKPSV